MKRGSGCLVILLGSILSLHAEWQTDRFSPDSAGLRIGFSAFNSGPEFHQLDATSVWRLPWRNELGKNWVLQSLIEFNAGWLGDPGHDAFVTSVGPGLMVFQRDFPVKVDIGVAPAFLSRPDFGSKDLGSNIQFITHAGMAVDLGPSLRFSYRFQHMSNGGLGAPNPGLNLHMLGVSYIF